MSLTVAEIAHHLDGEVQGDATLTLTGFAPANTAKAGDLTFAENAEYFTAAEQSAAAAILVSGDFKSSVKTLIRVKNARVAFARVLPLFFPESRPAPGIHPSAVVAPSAQVDPTAYVGPHCVVGERVKLGPRVILMSLVSIGDESELGEDTRIFPNVSIYYRTQIGRRVRIHSGTVVGSDGFGYVFDQGRHLKVPQIGNVILHDDVELGANVTVDRGALGPTVIGQGAKIDNLVQVAHNVQIGDHSIIVAQVGIAGSTKLGKYVVLGGQVGLAGHLQIGNQVTVAAQSGVMSNIPDGEKWLGSPAQPDRQTKRQLIAITQLPDLIKRVRELEKRLDAAKS
ncbi:MAG: UDP-3-O-(3-hydroxymyristoyl)glucosamine N-acyltransferase [Verrucomicrobiota bacterium]